MENIRIIEHGDIVYILEKVKTKRNINRDPNKRNNGDECIIMMLNKKIHPEVYERIKRRWL